MKRFRYLALLLALLCLLNACATAPVQSESIPTESQTLPETTEAPTTEETQPVPETTETTAPPETEPPTEPAVDVARELIRCGDYESALALLEYEEGEEAELLRLRAQLGDLEEGEQVTFGHYEQDNDLENGAEKIVWVVLAVDGEMALLLSLSCLDTQPYHSKETKITWADSYIRGWLNGEFCDAAFSATEQQLLAEALLENKDNPTYRIPGGEDTLDRVFLLSLDEVNTYLPKSLRYAHVTEYAYAQGCYRNASLNGWWWLRSPGVYSRDAAYIDSVAKVSVYGYVVDRPGWAIRPAVWIDLSV